MPSNPIFSDNTEQKFYEALKAEKYEEMSNKIQEGFDINRALNFEGSKTAPYTPLIWAAIKNNIPLAKFLLAKGAEINVSFEGREGNTPLQIASNHHNIAMIKLLLAYKAKIDDDCIMELLIGATFYDPDFETISHIIDLFLKNGWKGQSEEIAEKLNQSSRLKKHPTWELLIDKFLSIFERQNFILEPERVLVHHQPLKIQLENWFKNKETVYFIDCKGTSHYGKIESYQPGEEDNASIVIKHPLFLKEIVTYLLENNDSFLQVTDESSEKVTLIAENEIFFVDKTNLSTLDYFDYMFKSGFSESSAKNIDLTQTFSAQELKLLLSILNHTKPYNDLTLAEAESLIEVADRITAEEISDQARKRLAEHSDQSFSKALKAEKYEEMLKLLRNGANINQRFNSKVFKCSTQRWRIRNIIKSSADLIEFLIEKGYEKDLHLLDFSYAETVLLDSVIGEELKHSDLTVEETEILLDVAAKVQAFDMLDEANNILLDRAKSWDKTQRNNRLFTERKFFKELKDEEYERIIELLNSIQNQNGEYNYERLHYSYYRPLLWAVIENNLPLAEFLLLHGADANVACEGRDKNTPLQLATYNHNVAMIKLLLAYKANLDDESIIQLFKGGCPHDPRQKIISQILTLFLKKGFNDQSEKIEKLLSGWDYTIRSYDCYKDRVFLKIWKEQHFIVQSGGVLVPGKPSRQQVESLYKKSQQLYVVDRFGQSYFGTISHYEPRDKDNAWITFWGSGSLFLSQVTAYLKVKDNTLFVDEASRLPEKVGLKADKRIFWVDKSILFKKLPYFHLKLQTAFFAPSKKYFDLSETFSADELDVLLFIVDENNYDDLTLEQAQILAEVANKIKDIHIGNRAQIRIDEYKEKESLIILPSTQRASSS